MAIDLYKLKENPIYRENKLVEASYTLTVLEQKIIRLLAQKVSIEDDELQEYEFTASDLMKNENAAGKEFYKEIDNAADLLMKRSIKVRNSDTKEWRRYHWVDSAEFNEGMLKFRIHNDLKPFYVSLKSSVNQKMDELIQFKSVYSFRLYELLKEHENNGALSISIAELRHALEIGEHQYPKYANLKQKVISAAVNEINGSTDLYIRFVEIKTKRKVTDLKFSVKTKKGKSKKVLL